MKNLEHQLQRIKSIMLEQREVVSTPYNLLIESKAKKIGILINKLGLTPENAEAFFEKCGNQSVFLAKKLKEYLISLPSAQYDDDEKILKLYNDLISGKYQPIKNSITSIMDYIIVGLNGNRTSLENLTFNEINEKSKEWHDSLEIGDGDIDYKERNKIIADFRDKDGIGFYWVDFESNFCGEEKERMGHCANTDSKNTLYSLREVTKLGQNHTLNKSRLTAAVEPVDGIIKQLKGVSNSKPKEIYHPYIIALLKQKDDYDDYLINGFGAEYDSQNDFKLFDLSDNDFVKLYEDRPDLFTGHSVKKKLRDLEIADVEFMPMEFEMEISPDSLDNFIDCDYRGRTYKKKTPAGNEITVKTSFLELILTEPWDLYQTSDYFDLSSAIEYYIDSENEKLIENILKKYATEQEMDYEEDLSLEEKIDLYDYDDTIKDQIRWSMGDAEDSAYVEHLYETLKDCLEEYGTVISMNDETVKLKIDLRNFINDVSEADFDTAVEDCNENPECVFEFLLNEDFIEKPKFEISDYYSPDIDEKNFNELLKDRLLDR